MTFEHNHDVPEGVASAGNRPADALRDGPLKATIWRNDSASGAWYSVDLTRSYKDDSDQWHDATSLRASDLPRAALLLEDAYRRLRQLGREDRDGGAR